MATETGAGSDAAAAVPGPRRRPCILIADDDQLLLRSLVRLLAGDFDVVTACDGSEALARFFERGADLLLIDLHLPGRDGFEVTVEVRRFFEAGTIPIVIMTGEADMNLVLEAIDAGADDFILKPTSGRALTAKVHALLRGRELLETSQRQRAVIMELNAEREREAAMAGAVLDRMLGRSVFDANVRQTVASADVFRGDAILGAFTPTGNYRWLLGDVTGHSMSSALVTIPTSMIFYRTAWAGASLVDSVRAIDGELAALLPPMLFCAAAICELDRAAGVVQVWNGGVPDVVIRRGPGRITTCPSRNLPLGLSQRPDHGHQVTELAVAPGERIYAFSDGLIESRNAAGELLGAAAIHATLAGDDRGSEIFDRVLARWRAHADSVVEDDLSLIEVVV